MVESNELERELARVHGPDEEALARVRARMDFTGTRRHRAPARRVGRVRLGAVVAGAATIALVVALAPGDGKEHSRVPAPTSASAALLTAADSAADVADWKPLADGEFHHVYSTTFLPEVKSPFRAADQASVPGAGPFMPTLQATETWLDSTGRGVQLDISGGGGDPTKYPEIRPDRNGNILGYGGTLGNGPEAPDASRGLEYPDSVQTWRWPTTADAPKMVLWYRTPKGFIRGYEGSGANFPVGSLPAGSRAQVQYWGDTIEHLAALDELNGAALDRAIVQLLDDDPRQSPAMSAAWAKRFHVTPTRLRDEARLQRAVKLLGAAPLAPQARRALFSWLAKQPHAKLVGDATDELGREGTRVTFETLLDAPQPESTVTLDQLVDDAKGAGIDVDEPVDGKPSYSVPRHRAQRWWYVDVIFDKATGELLQQVQVSDWTLTAKVPSLGQTSRTGPGSKLSWHVEMNNIAGTMSDSAIYVTRERTKAVEPVAEVCRKNHNVCFP